MALLISERPVTAANDLYLYPDDVLMEYQTIGDLVSKETVCCVGGKVKH